MATHARGLICLTLTEERCRQLALPAHGERQPLAARDRVHRLDRGGHGRDARASRPPTARAPCAWRWRRHAKPEDIVQPGHIFPVMAQNGGVLVRAGHTEAGCDLAELAGLTPAAVICEIMKPDGDMARLPDLVEFAAAPRPQARHDRRPDPPPQREREADRARGRQADRHAVRPVPPVRLPRQLGGRGALRAGEGRALAGPARSSCACTSRSISIDMFDFDSSRHAYSVQDAMRIIAHHKEGVIVLLRRHEPAGGGPRALLAARRARAAACASGTRSCTASARRSCATSASARMRVLARPKRIPSMAGFGLEVVEYVSPGRRFAVKAV